MSVKISSVVLIFIMFIISLFAGLEIYNNQEYNSFIEKQHLGLIGANETYHSLIPAIPSVFQGIILIVVVIVILFLVFIGLYEHFTS